MQSPRGDVFRRLWTYHADEYQTGAVNLEYMFIQPRDPPVDGLHVGKEWKAELEPRGKEDEVDIVCPGSICKADTTGLRINPGDHRSVVDVRVSKRHGPKYRRGLAQR